MKKYDNLELRIMSCLLVKPKLMEQLIVEDKHFVKFQRLWQFMKAFYKKYGDFDIQLMYTVCKDKYKLIQYIEWLSDLEGTSANFKKYEKQLIEMYEENEKDKIIIDKVYEWANELYVRNMSVDRFKEMIDRIYEEVK